MGTRKYVVSGLNFMGGSPPDRTDIVRKEPQIKVSALCISYFRTVWNAFGGGGGNITPQV